MPPNRQRALELYRRPHAGAYAARLEPLTRRAISLLRPRPGEVVLDVGCGNGRSFPFIQPAIGAVGQLVGIDQSPEMLAKARRRVESAGWRNVALIQAAAEEAELAARGDAALFLCTHDVISSPPALRNVLRQVRPGGRVVAAGTMWSPWWDVAANIWNWYVARRYLTTLQDYGHPWTSLAHLVPDLRVEFVAIGGLVRRRGYVAWGTVPG